MVTPRAEAFNIDGPIERTALSPGGVAFPESARTWKGDGVPFRRGMMEACGMWHAMGMSVEAEQELRLRSF